MTKCAVGGGAFRLTGAVLQLASQRNGSYQAVSFPARWFCLLAPVYYLPRAGLFQKSARRTRPLAAKRGKIGGLPFR